MQIYIDGEYFEKEDAKISVFDHGLLYGDGIFEGIRFYNGRVFRLSEHIDRLFVSAKAILLDIGMTHDELEGAVLEAIRKNELQDGYVRLLVTRGIGTLGLSPFGCEKATIIIIADTISLYPEEKYKEGLKLITCSTRRTAPAALETSEYLSIVSSGAAGSSVATQLQASLRTRGISVSVGAVARGVWRSGLSGAEGSDQARCRVVLVACRLVIT